MRFPRDRATLGSPGLSGDSCPISRPTIPQESAENGVVCRPGEMFMDSGDTRRFAYSHAPDHEIRPRHRGLGRAIRAAD